MIVAMQDQATEEHIQQVIERMVELGFNVHRTTGAALYFGTLLLTWWLISAAEGPKSYRAFEACMTSLPGEFVLFCFTWALIHHLLGGDLICVQPT